jgi:hypothetical protein
MRLAWLVVLAGCYTKAPPPTISNRAEPSKRGLLTITEDGFGPLTAGSKATLTALRAAFTGYDVRAANDSGLSYSVYLGDEKLAWVIPNESDGSLFNVHATSPKVETFGHDWRVGQSFQGAATLTDCECWGDNPTCYRRGGHVAVNFKRSCEGLVGSDARALRVLDGVEIQRVIWSPKPFAGSSSEEYAAPSQMP